MEAHEIHFLLKIYDFLLIIHYMILHLRLPTFSCSLVLVPQRRELLFRIDARHDHLCQQHNSINARGQRTHDGPRQRAAHAPPGRALAATVQAARLVRHGAAPEREQQGEERVQVRQGLVQGAARDSRGAAGAGPRVERVETRDGGRQPAQQVRGGEQGGEREAGGQRGQGGEVGDGGEEGDEEQDGGHGGVLGLVVGGEALDV